MSAVWYPAAEPAAGIAAAARLFRSTFRKDPAGVWAAPGRVNLIGEHVDYNGGLCLPFALPHRTYLAATRHPDTLEVVSGQTTGRWSGRLAEIGPGRVHGWAGYVAGVPWALRRNGFDVGGMQAAVHSQVPTGAGLSSSAALECAVAVALDELDSLGLGGTDAGRAELAAACVAAENEVAGAPTGGMDQAAALRTRAGYALVLDCTDLSVRQVPIDLAAHGLAVLVIDTRVHHSLGDGQYGSRRAQCERAAALLGVRTLGDVAPPGLDALARLADAGEGELLARRVRHVVTEIERVRSMVNLLDAGRPEAIGPLLDASHASLRDDYEVSCVELDVACTAAREAGALGARMVGGGFGGSAIALVPDRAAGDIADAVARALAGSGSTEPAFLMAVPAGPAERVA